MFDNYFKAKLCDLDKFRIILLCIISNLLGMTIGGLTMYFGG